MELSQIPPEYQTSAELCLFLFGTLVFKIAAS